MHYTSHYQSPLGLILLAADNNGLCGLWFDGQKYFGLHLGKEQQEAEVPVITRAKHWLDIYFSDKIPDFNIPIHFAGTAFQNEICHMLCAIPYGQTTTYGQLARQIASRRGIKNFSARAVGSAVAHNTVSIIVPCHRVVGANDKLTGYAGGIERKKWLLQLEQKTVAAFCG